MSDLRACLVEFYCNSIIGCFLKKYFLTLFLLIVWALIFGIPLLLSRLNPPPAESQLLPIRVKILRVSDQQPNIMAMDIHGEVIALSFPTPLYEIFSKRTSVYLLSDTEKAQLTGCNANLYSSTVKYVWPESIRIWKIDCGTQSINYERIKSEFLAATKRAAYMPWFGAIVTALFVLLTFKQARKKK